MVYTECPGREESISYTIPYTKYHGASRSITEPHDVSQVLQYFRAYGRHEYKTRQSKITTTINTMGKNKVIIFAILTSNIDDFSLFQFCETMESDA